MSPNSGRLPAYRVGRRRLAVRRRDLDRLIAPRDAEQILGTEATTDDDGWLPLRTRLTLEAQRRGLAVMEELQAIQAELLAKRGGVLFPDSGQRIAEMRDERDRELMGDDPT